MPYRAGDRWPAARLSAAPLNALPRSTARGGRICGAQIGEIVTCYSKSNAKTNRTWHQKMLDFIDHLATGNDAEIFFQGVMISWRIKEIR
jgi:hypothetical protein